MAPCQLRSIWGAAGPQVLYCKDRDHITSHDIHDMDMDMDMNMDVDMGMDVDMDMDMDVELLLVG